MTSTAPSDRPARYAGLDGLRAIAVGLVVLYHLFPPALLPGGFVGVDVFFVLSGFLITSLLLREHAATGTVRLARFWQRRARRLLPALAVVVAVCATLAWIVGGDVLTRLGAQVFGAATFSYNWVSVAGGTGYFSDAAPELFRNFWSLAVEEQFYVVWPLLFPLFVLLPRAWMRVGVATLLAGASATWMGVFLAGGGDPTRAYFGTDTHAFGLLLGVALAFFVAPVLARSAAAGAGPAGAAPVETDADPGPAVDLPAGWTLALPASTRPVPTAATATRPGWMDTRAARTVTGIAGVLALAGIVGVAMPTPGGGTESVPGALLVASALSAVAILAGVWPGSWFGRALDSAPLRWIGDRSYAIYLWHWPLLVLAVAASGAATTADVPIGIGLGVLAATVAASALSYTFVEMPVRRRGFRATVAGASRRLRGGPRARVRVLGACVVAAAMLAGTGAAIAAAPGETTSEAAVEAGRAALERAQRDELDAAAAPTTSPSSVGEGGAGGEGEAGPGGEAGGGREAGGEAGGGREAGGEAGGGREAGGADGDEAAPAPEGGRVAGDQVSAVGDSVMLASAGGLLERMPGIDVDAEVSRSIWAGADIIDRLAAEGRLRPYVVVGLGTNGPVDPDVLEHIADTVGPRRSLVLVNAYAPRDWIPGVNAELQAFADARHNVDIADWSGAIGARTDLLAGDQIHPGDAGGRLFADTVAGAVDELAAEQQERRENLVRGIEQRLDLDLTPAGPGAPAGRED